MENFEEKFKKVWGDMTRLNPPHVVSFLMRIKIKKGLLPTEFTFFLNKRIKSKSSKIRQRFSSNSKLKNYILRRDNNRCIYCNSNYFLEIDHIKPIVHYPELAFTPSNLRTLCRKCHQKRHNNY